MLSCQTVIIALNKTYRGYIDTLHFAITRRKFGYTINERYTKDKLSSFIIITISPLTKPRSCALRIH